jgi:hypothetical protein
MQNLPASLHVLLAAVVSAVLLSSCASVSVKEVARIGREPKKPVPGKVFVAPFHFNERELRVDRSGADLKNFQYNLRELMTRNLVRRLPKYVAPAAAVAETAPLPRGNYWLISGNFDRIFQGSRILRSVIGLGVGATRMDATIVVSDLSGRRPVPFLRIVTTGGSNISPGIGGIATFFFSGPMALANIFNVVDGVRSGVTFDTIRTSREVNAVLSEYLYHRGAIPYEKAIGPKRLGKIPDRFGALDTPKSPAPHTVARPADGHPDGNPSAGGEPAGKKTHHRQEG